MESAAYKIISENNAFALKALPLLRILAEEGNCIDSGVDMTPTPRGGGIAAKEAYRRKAEIAKSICNACVVRLECGVYCSLNDVAPINGSTEASPAEERQIDVEVERPELFYKVAVEKHLQRMRQNRAV